MIKPVTAKAMSEIDKRAQDEYGIPASRLMENAGLAVAEHIISELSPFQNKRIAIFCGKGNNGGDGFVIARRLSQESPGSSVVFLAGEIRDGGGCVRDNYNIAKNSGIPIFLLADFLSDKCHLEEFSAVVDSIFGTGFHGELPPEVSALGKIINGIDVPCYAVDVPSGLDATTGLASENCIKADQTITFGFPKTGFFEKDGPMVCGKVIVRNIGFPEELLDKYRESR